MYTYSTQEQLKSEKPYHFSEYDPQTFLNDYKESRKMIGYQKLPQRIDTTCEKKMQQLMNSLTQQEHVNTQEALEIIFGLLSSGKNREEVEDLLKSYRRKFEIQKLKKIHQGETLKNIGNEA